MQRILKYISVIGYLLLASLTAASQMTPWFQWTFLPQSQMDLIIGEASGETALALKHTIVGDHFRDLHIL